MKVGSALVADAQPLELMQPGEGAAAVAGMTARYVPPALRRGGSLARSMETWPRPWRAGSSLRRAWIWCQMVSGSAWGMQPDVQRSGWAWTVWRPATALFLKHPS
ncbi:hypothetical protein GCM10010140_55670 [Streptosporangium pseudovulgare]|uniref:Uncharacterized protein n=1 Tax=Streptosporangium pseudovulgare TaxID=35765 RepID=A0ABQ2RBE2_9ACTN|nr:hypothetical protein GCM10010140_55670 [Streptosporangium pseudovulgare]